jgi:hypothetical protein
MFLKKVIVILFLSLPASAGVFEHIQKTPPPGHVRQFCDFLLHRPTPKSVWRWLMDLAVEALNEEHEFPGPTFENMLLRNRIISTIQQAYPIAVQPLSLEQRTMLLAGWLQSSSQLKLEVPPFLKKALVNHNELLNFVSTMNFLAVGWLLDIETVESIATAAIELGDNRSYLDDGAFLGQLGPAVEKLLNERLAYVSKAKATKALELARRAASIEMDLLQSQLNKMGPYQFSSSRDYWKYKQILTERMKMTNAYTKIESYFQSYYLE